MAKAKVTTKPVSWVSGTPIKYQSIVEYPVSKERTIRLVGDPMSTEEGALDSLTIEILKWEEAMEAFKQVILTVQ